MLNPVTRTKMYLPVCNILSLHMYTCFIRYILIRCILVSVKQQYLARNLHMVPVFLCSAVVWQWSIWSIYFRISQLPPRQTYDCSRASEAAHHVNRAWTSCQIRKIAGCACAGNAENVLPATADYRSRHTSRHVPDARAAMHAGIAN